MGVFKTNPVVEATADGYLKGQVWNRPAPSKKYLQLITKSVVDTSLSDPSNILPYAAWARNTASTDWSRVSGFLPADAGSILVSPFGFDFNAVGDSLISAYGYDVVTISKSYRYFVIAFQGVVRERISPEPTPVAEFTPDYSTLSVALGNKKISVGYPLLSGYLADTNLYPAGSQKNIVSLNSPTQKHFALIDATANDDIYIGKSYFWFGLELDFAAANLAPRVVPNLLPGSLPIPATVPPETYASMTAWESYLAGSGYHQSVTINSDPTITLAP